MLVVRGTKKLRDRLKGVPAATGGDRSTTVLDDWFANVLFWRPQVVLLVDKRTLLPVFMLLAPAATLLDRVPAAIESVLRLHGVDEGVLAAERSAMRDVRVAPTNDRRVVGVMNELAYFGKGFHREGLTDLGELSLRASRVLLSPLFDRTGSPDRELAEVLGAPAPTDVVAFTERSAPDATPVRSRPGASVYQLKVTLLDTKPPIWRRVLVAGHSTLGDLHGVIQAAFGWWNYHLHEFEVGPDRYGAPDPDEDWEPPLDERRTRIDAIATEGMSFRYTYDFGDYWQHKVAVEKILPATPDTPVPACIGGRRACPPEDCGGTWGYQELVEILADPQHPEHQQHVEWLGRPFDPEAFDPSTFEDDLRTVRLTALDD